MQDLTINNWGISSQIIVENAEKLGYQVKVLSKNNNLFSINKGDKKIYFKSVDCGINSGFGLKVANNKELTYILAEENQIRVPKSVYINRSEADSIELDSLDISYPVISKPVDGGHGDGVSLNLLNKNDLKKGLKYSFEDKDVSRVVVQEQIRGEDHRIIVLQGEVIAVSKRIPPYVIGNGKDSLQTLVEIENKNPARGTGDDHDSHMSPIKIDGELEGYLTEQGYSYKYIPEPEQKISVRKNANLSSGGLAIDMTDIIHPSIKDEAIKLAKIAGLGFCGVDYFCEDISKSLHEGKGAIIEINATPGIRMHHFPSEGKSRDVAGELLSFILQ